MNVLTTAAIATTAWCLTTAYIAHLVCGVARIAINQANPCDLASVLRAAAAFAAKAPGRGLAR